MGVINKDYETLSAQPRDDDLIPITISRPRSSVPKGVYLVKYSVLKSFLAGSGSTAGVNPIALTSNTDRWGYDKLPTDVKDVDVDLQSITQKTVRWDELALADIVLNTSNQTYTSAVISSEILSSGLKFTSNWDVNVQFCFVLKNAVTSDTKLKVDFILSDSGDATQPSTRTVSETITITSSETQLWPAFNFSDNLNYNHYQKVQLKLTWVSGDDIEFQLGSADAATEINIRLIPADQGGTSEHEHLSYIGSRTNLRAFFDVPDNEDEVVIKRGVRPYTTWNGASGDRPDDFQTGAFELYATTYRATSGNQSNILFKMLPFFSTDVYWIFYESDDENLPNEIPAESFTWNKDTNSVWKGAHSETATYQTGDEVIQASKFYKAKEDISAGAFDSSEWIEIGGVGANNQESVYNELVKILKKGRGIAITFSSATNTIELELEDAPVIPHVDFHPITNIEIDGWPEKGLGENGFIPAINKIPSDNGGNFYMIGNVQRKLYEIDGTTAAATQVGSTAAGFGVSETDPGGLALRLNGELWMSGNDTNSIYTLNKTTGAATKVGTASNLGLPQLVFIQSLEFLDDVLYGAIVTTAQQGATNKNKLVLINKDTGIAETIGTFTIGGTEVSVHGMASIEHNLYCVYQIVGGARHLGRVNTQNAKITKIGTASVTAEGLTSNKANKLWGAHLTGNYLIEINPETAAATRIGSATSYGVSETGAAGLAYIYEHYEDIKLTLAKLKEDFDLDGSKFLSRVKAVSTGSYAVQAEDVNSLISVRAGNTNHIVVLHTGKKGDVVGVGKNDDGTGLITVQDPDTNAILQLNKKGEGAVFYFDGNVWITVSSHVLMESLTDLSFGTTIPTTNLKIGKLFVFSAYTTGVSYLVHSTAHTVASKGTVIRYNGTNWVRISNITGIDSIIREGASAFINRTPNEKSLVIINAGENDTAYTGSLDIIDLKGGATDKINSGDVYLALHASDGTTLEWLRLVNGKTEASVSKDSIYEQNKAILQSGANVNLNKDDTNKEITISAVTPSRVEAGSIVTYRADLSLNNPNVTSEVTVNSGATKTYKLLPDNTTIKGGIEADTPIVFNYFGEYEATVGRFDSNVLITISEIEIVLSFGNKDFKIKRDLQQILATDTYALNFFDLRQSLKIGDNVDSDSNTVTLTQADLDANIGIQVNANIKFIMFSDRSDARGKINRLQIEHGSLLIEQNSLSSAGGGASGFGSRLPAFKASEKGRRFSVPDDYRTGIPDDLWTAGLGTKDGHYGTVLDVPKDSGGGTGFGSRLIAKESLTTGEGPDNLVIYEADATAGGDQLSFTDPTGANWKDFNASTHGQVRIISRNTAGNLRSVLLSELTKIEKGRYSVPSSQAGNIFLPTSSSDVIDYLFVDKDVFGLGETIQAGVYENDGTEWVLLNTDIVNSIHSRLPDANDFDEGHELIIPEDYEQGLPNFTLSNDSASGSTYWGYQKGSSAFVNNVGLAGSKNEGSVLPNDAVPEDNWVFYIQLHSTGSDGQKDSIGFAGDTDEWKNIKSVAVNGKTILWEQGTKGNDWRLGTAGTANVWTFSLQTIVISNETNALRELDLTQPVTLQITYKDGTTRYASVPIQAGKYRKTDGLWVYIPDALTPEQKSELPKEDFDAGSLVPYIKKTAGAKINFTALTKSGAIVARTEFLYAGTPRKGAVYGGRMELTQYSDLHQFEKTSAGIAITALTITGTDKPGNLQDGFMRIDFDDDNNINRILIIKGSHVVTSTRVAKSECYGMVRQSDGSYASFEFTQTGDNPGARHSGFGEGNTLKGAFGFGDGGGSKHNDMYKYIVDWDNESLAWKRLRNLNSPPSIRDFPKGAGNFEDNENRILAVFGYGSDVVRNLGGVFQMDVSFVNDTVEYTHLTIQGVTPPAQKLGGWGGNASTGAFGYGRIDSARNNKTYEYDVHAPIIKIVETTNTNAPDARDSLLWLIEGGEGLAGLGNHGAGAGNYRNDFHSFQVEKPTYENILLDSDALKRAAYSHQARPRRHIVRSAENQLLTRTTAGTYKELMLSAPINKSAIDEVTFVIEFRHYVTETSGRADTSSTLDRRFTTEKSYKIETLISGADNEPFGFHASTNQDDTPEGNTAMNALNINDVITLYREDQKAPFWTLGRLQVSENVQDLRLTIALWVNNQNEFFKVGFGNLRVAGSSDYNAFFVKEIIVKEK